MIRSMGEDTQTVSTTEDLTQSRSTIVDLFQAQVISGALSTALEVNNKSFSYTTLSSRADRLARDLRALIGSGYAIVSVTLADLFPQTFHLESVVELRRS